MVCSSIWGRPRLDISKESILSLRRLNYSWTKVARLLGISRKTLYRRLKEYNIDTSTFTDLSESELDELLSNIKVEHPNYGEVMLQGNFCTLELKFLGQCYVLQFIVLTIATLFTDALLLLPEEFIQLSIPMQFGISMVITR